MRIWIPAEFEFQYVLVCMPCVYRTFVRFAFIRGYGYALPQYLFVYHIADRCINKNLIWSTRFRLWRTVWGFLFLTSLLFGSNVVAWGDSFQLWLFFWFLIHDPLISQLRRNCEKIMRYKVSQRPFQKSSNRNRSVTNRMNSDMKPADRLSWLVRTYRKNIVGRWFPVLKLCVLAHFRGLGIGYFQ